MIISRDPAAASRRVCGSIRSNFSAAAGRGRSTFGASGPPASAAISAIEGAMDGDSTLASSLFAPGSPAGPAGGIAAELAGSLAPGRADGVLSSLLSMTGPQLEVDELETIAVTNWLRFRRRPRPPAPIAAAIGDICRDISRYWLIGHAGL
jgi:hypothetical protein